MDRRRATAFLAAAALSAVASEAGATPDTDWWAACQTAVVDRISYPRER